MTRPHAARRLVAVLSASVVVSVLVQPFPALADGITLNRNCKDATDSACAVEIAPSAASAVAVTGPSTGIGPAIELNLAVNQVADAGTPVQLSRSGGGGGGGGAESAGAAVNGFAVSVGQTGSATATSGNASAGTTDSRGSGSTAIQNPPSTGSDPGAGGGDPGAGQAPPSGGSTSGVNMITTVASIVQVVQVVARNNSNTTIAPVQLAEQCQQAAVSCSGNTAATHP
jgi:hypothetical protein